MSFFSILIFAAAHAAVPRISTVSGGQSDPATIFLVPGLVSVLQFRGAIAEVRVGNPQQLKVQISTVSPNEVTLSLSSSSSLATNLIVRAEKKTFVFDVVPSRSVHQDVVKIGNFSPSVFAIRQQISANPDTASWVHARPLKRVSLGGGK